MILKPIDEDLSTPSSEETKEWAPPSDLSVETLKKSLNFSEESLEKSYEMSMAAPVLTPSSINQALQAAGIFKKDEDRVNEARRILKENGASLEVAATAVAEALRNSDTRLRAAELTFRLHGIMKDADVNAVPSVNIIFSGQENKSLVQFLTPRER